MYCPVESSLENLMDGRLNGHYPAGCAAVAIAQILRYYKYPVSGQGLIEYTTKSGLHLGMKFDTCTFDWDHMPLTLTETSTEMEKQSVAKLISAVGLMLKTDYAIKGSEAKDGLFAKYGSAMVGFSGNISCYSRESYSINGWDSLFIRVPILLVVFSGDAW